ncbi:MAG: hypothetical protein FMNOHCHN_02567 [Ignavibacteriaceae bacterium]|nr:hypothetical protein [Ignavibacteriaceae bacterium]
MKTRLKTPKLHPELSLGNEHEKGTAKTFVWHLVKNGVDLSAAKDSIAKYLTPPQNHIP